MLLNPKVEADYADGIQVYELGIVNLGQYSGHGLDSISIAEVQN